MTIKNNKVQFVCDKCNKLSEAMELGEEDILTDIVKDKGWTINVSLDEHYCQNCS